MQSSSPRPPRLRRLGTRARLTSTARAKVEEVADASLRPRHLPSAAALRRAGRGDLADALRAVGARIEADYRCQAPPVLQPMRMRCCVRVRAPRGVF